MLSRQGAWWQRGTRRPPDANKDTRLGRQHPPPPVWSSLPLPATWRVHRRVCTPGTRPPDRVHPVEAATRVAEGGSPLGSVGIVALAQSPASMGGVFLQGEGRVLKKKPKTQPPSLHKALPQPHNVAP